MFVTVHWPASGEVQRLTDVPLDTALVVTQGAAVPARRERQPLLLRDCR